MDIIQLARVGATVVSVVSKIPWETLKSPPPRPALSEMLPEELKARIISASAPATPEGIQEHAPEHAPEHDAASCPSCAAAAAASDMYKRAQALAERVKAGELSREEAVQELRQVVSAPPSESSVTVGVSNEATLAYQVDHLLDELNLIETHLAEEGKIGGEPCDCISKAGRRIKAYAQETIPIAARQGKDATLYARIAEWGKKMQEIGTPEAIAAGQHDLLAESGVASNLRKALSKEHSLSSQS